MFLSRDASGALTVIQITLRSGLRLCKSVCNEIANELTQCTICLLYTSDQNDANEREQVVWVGLDQIFLEGQRVLPPVFERVLVQMGDGEEQAVFVAVQGLSLIHI